jgi:hypothetical protein
MGKLLEERARLEQFRPETALFDVAGRGHDDHQPSTDRRWLTGEKAEGNRRRCGPLRLQRASAFVNGHARALQSTRDFYENES